MLSSSKAELVDSNVLFTTAPALSSNSSLMSDTICSEILEQRTATFLFACLEEGECVVVLE